ncbi:MAG: 4Fe-4S binding protein [Faecalibacterium sp.]
MGQKADHQKRHSRIRLLTQAVWFALTNGYAQGFLKGKIYTGSSKQFCVPGLNCYSCPGALGACPIGALQAVLGSKQYRFSCYVLGTLMMFGAAVGRFICGWLCPFGLVQDLLHRIPLFKKIKTLPGHRWLRYLKYVVLALLVILLPATVRDFTGMGSPWFCEWLCPSGTLLGGVPLMSLKPNLRSAIGFHFWWKLSILIIILVTAIKVDRPFCKYLCPLGAFYGICNPVSIYRLRVDTDKCVKCGACQRACGMDIKVWEHPNDPECIRCGACKAACPTGAITSSMEDLMQKAKKDHAKS